MMRSMVAGCHDLSPKISRLRNTMGVRDDHIRKGCRRWGGAMRILMAASRSEFISIPRRLSGEPQVVTYEKLPPRPDLRPEPGGSGTPRHTLQGSKHPENSSPAKLSRVPMLLPKVYRPHNDGANVACPTLFTPDRSTIFSPHFERTQLDLSLFVHGSTPERTDQLQAVLRELAASFETLHNSETRIRHESSREPWWSRSAVRDLIEDCYGTAAPGEHRRRDLARSVLPLEVIIVTDHSLNADDETEMQGFTSSISRWYRFRLHVVHVVFGQGGVTPEGPREAILMTVRQTSYDSLSQTLTGLVDGFLRSRTREDPLGYSTTSMGCQYGDAPRFAD